MRIANIVKSALEGMAEESLSGGLEALTDGKARIEKEDMLLVKPVDFSFMEKHKGLLYQSWEIRSEYEKDSDNNQGMVRVRQEGDKYHFVTKLFDAEDGNPLESEVLISKDFFDICEKLFPIGSRKMRFRIPTDNPKLTWEVDVYLNPDDSIKSEWVKLDMEYPEGVDLELPALPFECSEVMGPEFSEDEDEVVEELFEETFNIYNESSMLPIACKDDDDDEDEKKDEDED